VAAAQIVEVTGFPPTHPVGEAVKTVRALLHSEPTPVHKQSPGGLTYVKEVQVFAAQGLVVEAVPTQPAMVEVASVRGQYQD
jgi:hypothetical protein